MREGDGSAADTAGRRMTKMSRVEKLASVALVIAGAGSLILLEIYFPQGGNAKSSDRRPCAGVISCGVYCYNPDGLGTGAKDVFTPQTPSVCFILVHAGWIRGLCMRLDRVHRFCDDRASPFIPPKILHKHTHQRSNWRAHAYALCVCGGPISVTLDVSTKPPPLAGFS